MDRYPSHFLLTTFCQSSPELVKLFWQKRRQARQEFPSYLSLVLNLWKCLLAWGLPEFATFLRMLKRFDLRLFNISM